MYGVTLRETILKILCQQMQNDVHGFHHSRKAIQLRTHLSNEALYQQHPDSNGTASTISRHKTRPETFLQRTSNAHIT